MAGILDFEKFQLKDWFRQIKDNPARLFYGGIDPFSTGMWNKILGKDDAPLINQWGGPTEQRFADADAAGINTTPSRNSHALAQMIAQFYAMQGLGNSFGGSGGAPEGAISEIPASSYEALPRGGISQIPAQSYAPTARSGSLAPAASGGNSLLDNIPKQNLGGGGGSGGGSSADNSELIRLMAELLRQANEKALRERRSPVRL